MRIPVVRERFSNDAAKLRRARRLYAQLVYKELMRNPDMTYVCAQRAIARGLYAPTATMRDVTFSLVRKIYHCDRGKRGMGRDGDWKEWLRTNRHADWYVIPGEKSHVKPILRVVA